MTKSYRFRAGKGEGCAYVVTGGYKVQGCGGGGDGETNTPSL